MRAAILACWCCGLFVVSAADPFEERAWEDRQGRSFRAEIHHLEGDTVFLKAARGGRIYQVGTEKLSEACSEYLANLKKEVELHEDPLDSKLLIRAMALELKREALRAGMDRFSLKIERFRVESDRRSAIFEYKGPVFEVVKAPTNFEFVTKGKDLMLRAARRHPSYRLYREDFLIATEGEAKVIEFDDLTRMRWDKVGVVEGPVIEGRPINFNEARR